MTDTDQSSNSLPSIVTIGEPRLAQPAAPVKVAWINTPRFRKCLKTLIYTMVENLGIGIAAPQVGWYRRFFVMMLDDPLPAGQQGTALSVWVNPEIVATSDEYNWAWEGCLSVPNLRGWIRRPSAIAVRGYNEIGEPVSREFTGWMARVFQHEYDHLDGMLFPYRAVDPKHLVTLEELARRQEWPADWPAPGARDAAMGQVLEESRIMPRTETVIPDSMFKKAARMLSSARPATDEVKPPDEKPVDKKAAPKAPAKKAAAKPE